MEITSGISQENPRSLIHQRYEIQEKLGEGGFAQTFLALDHRTGTKCVLKIVDWKEIPDWKFLELFEREARVLSQLNHPSIPHFIEFIQEKIEDENKIILAQEFIPGKNLSQFIEQGKHFTEKEAIDIAIETAKILEYLQTFSPPIIHRDIKPSNILLSEDGTLHLIDFGAVRDKVLHLQKTEAGGFTVVGTYGYMPFEQFQGQAVPASDVYSLGVTLITLLSHREPHQFEQIGSKLQFEPYINVSDGFKEILQKMTAFRPEDRYRSAKELLHDLQLLGDGKLKSRRTVVRTQRKTILWGAAAALAILTLSFSLLYPFRSPQPVPVTKSVTAPFVIGKGVRGRLTYDGRPVTEISGMRPQFWFRDENSGKATTARTIYENGEFQFTGLADGRYGVSIQMDINGENPISYPGDLRAWKTFNVSGTKPVFMDVEMWKVIRMLKPEDNQVKLPDWARCCEDHRPALPPKLKLEWEQLGPGVTYDYNVTKVKCPYTSIGSAANGTTRNTSVQLDLQPNEPSEFYILTVEARKNGVHVGTLMTHGSNGYSWDYRFTVPQDGR